MQIRPEQLGAHLQRPVQALYTVFGDEPLLALEAADAVRTQARAQGYSEREVFTVEGNFNWQALLLSGNNLSLFASRRILEIRIPSGKPGLEGSKTLESYCANLPPDTLTLVSLPKLDKTAQNSKWFKALDQAGVTIPVYPVERARLPAWVGQRLAAQNQRADADTLQFLADKVEGNLLAAFQEVQKLALLYPAGMLSFEQVKDAVYDVARYDVFKLTDALLEGDSVRTVRILDGLRGEGVDPVLVLWALAREVRILARVQYAVRQGAAMPQALRAERIWDARQPLVQKALRRLSLGRLGQALRRAAELDKMIKGLVRGDAWDELQQLGLHLAR
ncbi:MAG: DNA polymerase III subunit delta [Sulfuricellaceae bacterium]|nr:DNA polymerase III subunit delta [Sulfuricellaceae bacterium]